MMKKTNALLIPFVLLFLYLEMLQYPNLIIKTVHLGLSIWIHHVVPILFPFFVASSLLMSTGFEYIIGELCKPLMYFLFKMKSETAIVLMLSFFNGFPSGAKYTKELYEEGVINENEASKLLVFTHYANPLFVIGTVGTIFLNDKSLGVLLLVTHYMGGLITGILFRSFWPSQEPKTPISLKKAWQKMNEIRLTAPNLGILLYQAIQQAIDTLFSIVGIIILFMILTNGLLHHLPLHGYVKCMIQGFLEMTGGLHMVHELPLSIKNKAVLTALLLSFSGLAIHMQVYSIICETKIKFWPFFVARIIHPILSTSLVLFYFQL